MAEEKGAATEDRVYASMDELFASGPTDTEYAVLDGFKPGEKIRIGSVTAGDFLEWQDTLEGPEKRMAGLRLICKSLVGPAPGNIRYAADLKGVSKLRDVRHKETERILKAIVELNGMRAKDQEKAKNE